MPKGLKLTAAEELEFAQWYALFPRKRSKSDGQKAWAQTRDKRPPLEQMLRTLDWQNREFAKREEAAVPYPATYLRDGGFLDQPPPVAKPGGAPVHAPPNPYCPWHRDPARYYKPANKPLATCPACKHLAAAAQKRTGEPQSLADLAGDK